MTIKIPLKSSSAQVLPWEDPRRPEWLEAILNNQKRLVKIQKFVKKVAGKGKLGPIYGCGYWGCVMPWVGTPWVVKITRDPKEGPMWSYLQDLAREVDLPGLVRIKAVVKLGGKKPHFDPAWKPERVPGPGPGEVYYEGRVSPVFLVVREDVGPLELGGERGLGLNPGLELLNQYLDIAREEYGRLEDLNPIAEQLSQTEHFYKLGELLLTLGQRGIFLKDVRAANIGWRTHATIEGNTMPTDSLVLYDPGITETSKPVTVPEMMINPWEPMHVIVPPLYSARGAFGSGYSPGLDMDAPEWRGTDKWICQAGHYHPTRELAVRCRSKKRNPADEDMRELERAAKLGDPYAIDRLARELQRRGVGTQELTGEPWQPSRAWKHGTVKIAYGARNRDRKPGQRHTVKRFAKTVAPIRGNWAITRPFSEAIGDEPAGFRPAGWVLTHKPTGFAIVHSSESKLAANLSDDQVLELIENLVLEIEATGYRYDSKIPDPTRWTQGEAEAIAVIRARFIGQDPESYLARFRAMRAKRERQRAK